MEQRGRRASMEKLSVGDIVFVNFPFSDLTKSKLRPAVIVAQAQSDDWVLCQITSKAYSDNNALIITDQELNQGTLKLTSYIRPLKIFTANESIINKKVAELKVGVQRDLLDKLVELLKGE